MNMFRLANGKRHAVDAAAPLVELVVYRTMAGSVTAVEHTGFSTIVGHGLSELVVRRTIRQAKKAG